MISVVKGMPVPFICSPFSPVVKAESLSWAAEGIKMFGFGGLQPRPALECIKKGLADTNPAVRTAAVGLLGREVNALDLRQNRSGSIGKYFDPNPDR